MSRPIDNLLDLFRIADRAIEDERRSDGELAVRIILHGDTGGWFCELFIDDKFRHAFILHDVHEFATAIELFDRRRQP
jgi:hypothetical protein